MPQTEVMATFFAHIDVDVVLRTLVVDWGSGVLAGGAAGALVAASTLLGRRGGRAVLTTAMMFLLVPTYAIAGCFSNAAAAAWPDWSPASLAGRSATALLVVTLISAIARFPLVVLLLVLGLRGIDPARAEDAWVSGGWRRWLGSVVAVSLWPWWLCGVATAALLTHVDMVVTNLYGVRTLTETVHLQAALGDTQSLTVWAATLTALLPAAIAGFTIQRLPASAYQRLSLWRPKRLGPVRVVAYVTAASVLALAVGRPFYELLWRSGYHVGSDGGSFQGRLMLRSIADAFTSFGDEWYWSLTIAAISGMLTAAVVVLLSLGWEQAAIRRGAFITALLMLALPGPVVAAGLTSTFNRPGAVWQALYGDSLVVVLVGLQFRLLPLGLAVFAAAMATRQSRYGAQWALDGGGRWTAWRLRMAGMWPTVVAAAAIAAIVSVGELSTYLGVLPAGVSPLAVRIFELLHYAVRYREAGLLLLMTVAAAVCSGVFIRRYVL